MNADAYRGSLIRVLGTNPGSLEEQQMLLASLQPQKIMSMCSMCVCACYVQVSMETRRFPAAGLIGGSMPLDEC